MAHSIAEHLHQFLRSNFVALDDRSLRAECGRFVSDLALSPIEQGLLLIEVMQAYTNHCSWNPQGAKMWQLMEYLVRRPKLEFNRQSVQDCLTLLPYFAECCFPSETLTALVARNIARLGYWPALTPALEGVYEMRRKSSRSQGAGRIAGLLLWNDPNMTIWAAEQCATMPIRAELFALSAAWQALFLNLTPWKNEPTTPWLRSARPLLERVRSEEYSARVGKWAESLAERSPINISAPGAEVLKSLLWHFDLLPPGSGTRALRAFCKVEYQRSCHKLAEKVDLALARLLERADPNFPRPSASSRS